MKLVCDECYRPWLSEDDDHCNFCVFGCRMEMSDSDFKKVQQSEELHHELESDLGGTPDNDEVGD